MRKVEVHIQIQATTREVIRAFTDPELLKWWWGVERSLIESRVGGLYTLAWHISDHGFGYVSSGIIHDYDPDGKLVISDFVYLNPEKPFLGPMGLTVEAKESPDGTHVYLCQDGYRDGEAWDWYYGAVKEAWPIVMASLKQFLEQR